MNKLVSIVVALVAAFTLTPQSSAQNCPFSGVIIGIAGHPWPAPESDSLHGVLSSCTAPNTLNPAQVMYCLGQYKQSCADAAATYDGIASALLDAGRAVNLPAQQMVNDLVAAGTPCWQAREQVQEILDAQMQPIRDAYRDATDDFFEDIAAAKAAFASCVEGACELPGDPDSIPVGSNGCALVVAPLAYTDLTWNLQLTPCTGYDPACWAGMQAGFAAGTANLKEQLAEAISDLQIDYLWNAMNLANAPLKPGETCADIQAQIYTLEATMISAVNIKKASAQAQYLALLAEWQDDVDGECCDD